MTERFGNRGLDDRGLDAWEVLMTERFRWLKGFDDWEILMTGRFRWLKGLDDWKVLMTEIF